MNLHETASLAFTLSLTIGILAYSSHLSKKSPYIPPAPTPTKSTKKSKRKKQTQDDLFEDAQSFTIDSDADDKWLERFSDPVETLEDMNVCVTGEFRFGDRDAVHAALRRRGARIHHDVSENTDILVVGSLGDSRWSNGDLGGRKVERAHEHFITITNEHIVFGKA